LRVVLDTNVLVAALRSAHGASFTLLSALPSPNCTPVLSVPLYVEYQDVLLRPGMLPPGFTPADILAYCRFLASISHQQEIFFLWRAHLRDPKDDMILELAVAAQARYITTHNLRDFVGVEDFGVIPICPADFLKLVRRLP
jgi:putative PIN family toxin of toxin-antitoxin system